MKAKELKQIFEENYELVDIEETCATVPYPQWAELSVIRIINTFEKYGVKCNEHYYDEKNGDWIIPFKRELTCEYCKGCEAVADGDAKCLIMEVE